MKSYTVVKFDKGNSIVHYLSCKSPLGIDTVVQVEWVVQFAEINICIRASVLDQFASSLLGVFTFLFAN
jgi:hypothetical protein